MSIRFFSAPSHQLITQGSAPEERTEPRLPESAEVVEKALAGTEFRDVRAPERVRSLLSAEYPLPLPAPDERSGPAAIFARPPQDLPALLRLADQLESLAKKEEGERALVWSCQHCQTHYAVPLSLARHVAIHCERCGERVELDPQNSLGEQALLDPFRGQVNEARRELAQFFREAMARGWSVLVCDARGI